MKTEIIERVTSLIIAAFGLIAALALNDAIKDLFTGPCGTVSAGLLCGISKAGPWVYAIIVTVIAVAVTIWLSKLSQKK